MIDTICTVVGAALLLMGAAFILISAIGIVRYPCLLSRQHIATKPQVFSLILFLLGVMVLVRDTAMTFTLLIVIVFQLISSPISAHMLARAGYRSGRVKRDTLMIDELNIDTITSCVNR